MGTAPYEDEGLHEKWAELLMLRQSAPSPPPKGHKPDEATIAAMKAHKAKESQFLGELSKEASALLKRYEKALKRPSPKVAAASGGGGSKQDGENARPKVPSRVKWINEDAPQFWSQRRSCDRLATGWDEVARLFGLANL
jgi:hypothetical protein|eukprot:COSAG02_NODE_6845_length_3329_cov_85.690093_2_plen_140_part_00